MPTKNWFCLVLTTVLSSNFALLSEAYPDSNSAESCVSENNQQWVPTQYDPVLDNVRCLSNDGIHCLWLDSIEQCMSSSGSSFLECGEPHRNIYGNTGFEDPNSWCSRAKHSFESPRGSGNTPPSASPPSKVILGDESPIHHVPEQDWGNSPDGNMVSIPYENQFALYYPNAKNYRHMCPTPFFQDVADSDFQLVYGWVPCDNPDKLNTFFAAGMWIFAVFPTDSGRLIGLGHAESGISSSQGCQGAGSGDFTYKTITVSYSYDSGSTWTDPQIIISAGSLDTSQPTTFWSGAGDPGFVKTGNEYRAYFYSNGRFSFARTYDPYASPGSWTVLKNDGSFVDALNFGGDLRSLNGVPVGPNPHITYSSSFNKFIMTIWGWGSPYVTFLWSQDGLEWQVIDNIFIKDDILSRPLYPTIVSYKGSTEIDQDGYLYYAKWSSPSFRTMYHRTIRFE